MLREALRSIERQIGLKTVILVNHSVTEVMVKKTDFSGLSDLVVINLPNLNLKRGVPLNHALRYIIESTSTGDGIAFLDDDDIVYPQFVQTLVSDLKLNDRNVAYGSTMKCVVGATPVPAFEYKPIFELYVNNFIPINAYIIDLKKYRKTPVFFDENLTVLEDWLFLIQLLNNGFKFGYTNTFVSEFRLHNDGSSSLNEKTVANWKSSEEYIQKYLSEAKYEFSGKEFGEFVFSIRERRASLLKISQPSVEIKPSFIKRAVRFGLKFIRRST